MRLCTCEHPKYVLSPHTGEMIRVACNNCSSCRNQRAKRWITRLDTECQQHRFTYMVTLTYDDEHLPKLMYCEDDPDYIEFVNRKAERIPLQELIDLCIDKYGEYLEEDLKYLRERLAHPLGLPCVFSKDISDFFKRINKYTFKHITGHYENYRYFVCHEYGPTTFRCHSHMLIWFDDSRIDAQFQEVLSSCWKFGDCRSDAVYSDGGKNYVAQYVNMSCHLPAFYSHSRLRQRQQFSKCPSIGSFDILGEKVRDLYSTLPVTRSVWDSSSGKYIVVPIQTSVKSRFFPKLQGYCDLSYFDRVTLYGVCYFLPASDFEEFKNAVQDCVWLQFRQIQNPTENVFASYYARLKITAEKEDSLTNSLYRWYGISKRICTFASSLGVSLNYIVERIDEFWKKVDYENLKNFYSWQETYVKKSPVQDLLAAYPEMYWLYKHYVFSGDFNHLSRWQMQALESFCIFEKEDFRELENTYDFQEMKSTSFKIYKDTHKAHAVNAYLYSQKFKDSDPLLQKIIISYKKWQKEI